MATNPMNSVSRQLRKAHVTTHAMRFYIVGSFIALQLFDPLGDMTCKEAATIAQKATELLQSEGYTTDVRPLPSAFPAAFAQDDDGFGRVVFNWRRA